MDGQAPCLALDYALAPYQAWRLVAGGVKARSGFFSEPESLVLPKRLLPIQNASVHAPAVLHWADTP